MNLLNYATLSASQRLVNAGIVLETEAVWIWPNYKEIGNKSTNPDNICPYLSQRCCREVKEGWKHIPAPSMAEVWRELPGYVRAGVPDAMSDECPFHDLEISKDGDFTIVQYLGPAKYENTNPTDALIDLLIWTTERKEKP